MKRSLRLVGVILAAGFLFELNLVFLPVWAQTSNCCQYTYIGSEQGFEDMCFPGPVAAPCSNMGPSYTSQFVQNSTCQSNGYCTNINPTVTVGCCQVACAPGAPCGGGCFALPCPYSNGNGLTVSIVENGTCQVGQCTTADYSVKKEPSKPIYFTPQVTIPGSILVGGKEFKVIKGEGIPINGATAAQYFSVFYKFFVAAIAIMAIVMVSWGGFKRIMAAGSPERIKSANETIMGAITGIVIALISYSLLSLVNPALVSLKTLSIDPILTEELDTNRSGDDINSDNFTSNCSTQPITGTNGVPLYKQSCYANVPFGPNSQPCGDNLLGSSIKSSGCGPTSLSMVLSFYGKSVDPIEAAKTWADSGFRVCKNGVGENYGTALVSDKVVGKYGMKGEYVSWSKALDLLRQNKPVIVSVGSSIFTSSGHFIVLTGISGDKILVNDPAKDCYIIDGAKDCSRMVSIDYIAEHVKGEGGAYYIHQ